ncbi:MAG: hypothetical protein DRR19_06070 [Candidatus Parabeggiatoa sp. nov. 1]|nr:MAG: hypothetical protein DRR19_06070 [Gammaproteobacteria bacterium]
MFRKFILLFTITLLAALAVNYLEPLKKWADTSDGKAEGSFENQISPAYDNLVDVLLQQKGQLVEVQQTLESAKRVELQDYFGEKAISKQALKVPELEQGTAVLYPVLLPDRTELLLNFSGSLCRVRTDVPGDKISKTAKRLHYNIQNKASGRFIEQARQLYDWLIVPIKPHLAKHQIKTLITIPDGALRLIPMAGLFNNNDKVFLIHEYALATTPSLYLTSTHSLPKENLQIMLNGLSEAVQGFTPLKNVPHEINSIKSLFGGSDEFLDKQFTLGNLQQSLKQKPYKIVHIASHGQFNHNLEDTFVLTYDDKLTMKKLENLLVLKRDNPIELLTLSACQTAMGDERSALGLAGVAIKAGVGSALASLWAVNDQSTTLLMQEFYHQLQKPDMSKAKALQQAQIKIASDGRFRHPAYWAPFLLIGNWL